MISERERKKREEFFKLMQENPELPVVAMVYSEVVQDDGYSRWMGAWGSCRQRSISWEKITCAPGLAARCRIRSILCSRRDLS